MLRTIKGVLKRAQPEDLVILSLAMHGLLGDKGEELYFLTHEADPQLPEDDGISRYELMRQIKKSKAGKIVILLDACHAGALGLSSHVLGNRSIQSADINRLLVAMGDVKNGVAILASSSAAESSKEGPQFCGGHGAFTCAVLTGLRGAADTNHNGLIELRELYDHTYRKVQDETQGYQTPDIESGLENSLPLAFVKEDTESPTIIEAAGNTGKDVDTGNVSSQQMESKRVGRDGAVMVLLPEGEFQMGSTPAEVEAVVKECVEYDYAENQCLDWFQPELPRHEVSLQAFYMDVYEVSNLLFEKFVSVTGFQTTARREGDARAFVKGKGWEIVKGAYWRKPEGGRAVFISNRADHPVVSVSWDDAYAYCKHYDKRLPTEAEWEYAARAGTVTRNWWGNAPPESRPVANIADVSAKELLKNYLSSYDDGFERTAPVKMLSTNPWGLYNIIGNVAEWTGDWYDKHFYQKSPQWRPTGPQKGKYRVIRGGSWNYGPFDARSANRDKSKPSDRYDNVGFRCVQDAA